MAGTRWTPGRILLLLFLIGTFTFFATLMTMIGRGVSSAVSSIATAANVSSPSAPPEIKTLVGMAVTLFALLGSSVFIAILVAGGVIRDVLEKG